MVICPIARMMHCTGCMLVNICPLKTILGDYNKVEACEQEKAEENQTKENSSAEPPSGVL